MGRSRHDAVDIDGKLGLVKNPFVYAARPRIDAGVEAGRTQAELPRLSDFDGIGKTPKQLEDVSCYPYITQELLNRGHKKEDILKVLGGNALRVLRDAEKVAKDWKK